MENTAYLVSQNGEKHHGSDTLEASACRTGTGTEEHTDTQYDPCRMVPLGSIIVEDSRRGNE